VRLALGSIAGATHLHCAPNTGLELRSATPTPAREAGPPSRFVSSKPLFGDPVALSTAFEGALQRSVPMQHANDENPLPLDPVDQSVRADQQLSEA